MGRKPKYFTDEERHQAYLERKRKYDASEKGRQYNEQYRMNHRDYHKQYFQFRYLMKTWGNLYDAITM